jgi:hypothetical protein
MRVACSAVEQTGAIGGDVYALVTAPDQWMAGNDVVVCVAVVEKGLTGFTPMPNNATVHAKLRVRIEQPPTPTDPPSSAEAKRSTAIEPTGLWDSWCD